MIRKATVEDLQVLLELEEMCFQFGRYSKEQIESFLKGPNEETFLYLDEDGPMGSMLLSVRDMRGRVVSLGVHPDRRNKGVARELMTIAEEWFLDSCAQVVDLEVGVDNREALKLYSSLGYEVVRTLKNYYRGKGDAYLMRKELE